MKLNKKQSEDLPVFLSWVSIQTDGSVNDLIFIVNGYLSTINTYSSKIRLPFSGHFINGRPYIMFL